MNTSAATAANPATADTGQPSLAERLRSVRVGLRNDLDVTRVRVRGEARYVVRDPLTFQNQLLTPADYSILVRLTPELSLGELFSLLCATKTVRPEDESAFYEFIVGLHRLGFLNLPISDHAALFKRYQLRQSMRLRQRIFGILFLQVPLFNPDTFLARTLHLARWLFTTPAFVAWCVLLMAAGVVAWARSAELYQPLGVVLATQNLPLIWMTLIVLKALHELGHGYACKHYGGYVPETGVMLVLFTPCAYVDATACWGFASKWQRLVVCLAGMYVESFIAALALFVWAATGPGLAHAVAYNVMFLAGVATVLFNINPLMRYDGYYILSDLLEIPNLRARAAAALKQFSKRFVLGLRDLPLSDRGRVLAILLGFGAASAVYRVLLMVGIAAAVSYKLKFVGLLIGSAALVATFSRPLYKALSYLWSDRETAAVRGRARGCAVALVAAIPLILFAIPVRHHLTVSGVTKRLNETIVRATTPGFVVGMSVEPSNDVTTAAPLAQLDNDQARERLQEAEMQLASAEFRAAALRATDPGAARAAEHEATALREALTIRAAEVSMLNVCAPHDGRVIWSLPHSAAGSYVPVGAPLATVVDGPWEVRALLTAEEAAAITSRRAEPVEFRPSNGGSPVIGVIRQIRPAGGREIPLPSLTQVGGGHIFVDGQGRALEPYFEVLVELESNSPAATAALQPDGGGCLRIAARPETLAQNLSRRLARFIDLLLKS